MREVVRGVYTFTGLMAGRVYLVTEGEGLTIIDAGLPFAAARIARQLKRAGYDPTDVKRILVTHAHSDHVGGLENLVQITGAEVIAHEIEKPYVEGTADILRAGGATYKPSWAVPVDRTVTNGEIIEEVEGGMQALHTPGHSPGHTSYLWLRREVLFCGDVMMNVGGKLRLPIRAFTPDMAEDQRSILKLVALNVHFVCPGHGLPIVTYAARAVRRLSRRLDLV